MFYLQVTMKYFTKRKIGWAVIIFIAVIALTTDIGLYANSFVSPTTVILIPAALGAASAIVMWRLWRSLSGSEKYLPNFLIHTAVSGIMIALLILGLNRLFADESSLHSEMAVAERVYYQTRKRNKRVGRRYLPTGEEYKVYYMDVRLGNGKEKKIPLSANEYNRTRKGDTIVFKMEKGLFGIPVIMPEKYELRKKRGINRLNPALRQ